MGLVEDDYMQGFKNASPLLFMLFKIFSMYEQGTCGGEVTEHHS